MSRTRFLNRSATHP